MNRAKDERAERCKKLADLLIPPLRHVAYRHGYALGVHGMLAYDIDLIAWPWREGCVSGESLAVAFRDAVAAIVGDLGVDFIGDDGPTERPHGRLAWSIHISGGVYIDLSVMPRLLDKGDKQ